MKKKILITLMTSSTLFIGWIFLGPKENSTPKKSISSHNAKAKKQGSLQEIQDMSIGNALENFVSEKLLNRAPSSVEETASEIPEAAKKEKTETAELSDSDFHSQIKDLSETESREIVLLKKDIEFQETFLESMKESGETPEREIEIYRQVIEAKKKQFKDLLNKHKAKNDQD